MLKIHKIFYRVCRGYFLELQCSIFLFCLTITIMAFKIYKDSNFLQLDFFPSDICIQGSRVSVFLAILLFQNLELTCLGDSRFLNSRFWAFLYIFWRNLESQMLTETLHSNISDSDSCKILSVLQCRTRISPFKDCNF